MRKERKKKQTVQWHVRFIDIVTDEINSMVKFIREYADGKILLVYTDDITEGITVRFKKKNRMVTWNFYW
jgi:nicotinic acid phosphoribosyltransferase